MSRDIWVHIFDELSQSNWNINNKLIVSAVIIEIPVLFGIVITAYIQASVLSRTHMRIIYFAWDSKVQKSFFWQEVSIIDIFTNIKGSIESTSINNGQILSKLDLYVIELCLTTELVIYSVLCLEISGFVYLTNWVNLTETSTINWLFLP